MISTVFKIGLLEVPRLIKQARNGDVLVVIMPLRLSPKFSLAGVAS